MDPFHPDLRWAARIVPRFVVGPRTHRLLRWLAPPPKPPLGEPGVRASLMEIPGGGTARVFIPEKFTGPMPVMLWVHGGGFILGSPAQDDAHNITFAKELGMTVLAPSYPLAPEHRYPAALETLYTTLKWIHANAATLNVRTDRIVIAGGSAGGGLAAGLTLMARDRNEVPVAFQLLVYPMLDDRTVLRVVDGSRHRLWNAASNVYGWSSYLGREPGGAGVEPYAAPARAPSLEGLPPTWIGVGTLDLFHDEDVEYARRLQKAGVPVQVEIVPGAFHGFDGLGKAPVAKRFTANQVDALRRALA